MVSARSSPAAAVWLRTRPRLQPPGTGKRRARNGARRGRREPGVRGRLAAGGRSERRARGGGRAARLRAAREGGARRPRPNGWRGRPRPLAGEGGAREAAACGSRGGHPGSGSAACRSVRGRWRAGRQVFLVVVLFVTARVAPVTSAVAGLVETTVFHVRALRRVGCV